MTRLSRFAVYELQQKLRLWDIVRKDQGLHVLNQGVPPVPRPTYSQSVQVDNAKVT